MSEENQYLNDQNDYLKHQEYFLQAEDLTMHFPVKSGGATHYIHAADHVTFRVPKGQTLGVVGESGCGKSTVGKMLMNLYQPTSGKVIYEGKDITHLKGKERKPYVQKMQLVWQDPYSSLDPRMRAWEIVAEGIRNFFPELSVAERKERAIRIMEQCGLRPEHATFYPHQFSGGQRQRLCIARALATEPEFIVCDEAVSALDVSVQAQIINLLKDLQDELKLTYLFISHDLNIVRFISDEIIVMYLGQIVERGTVDAVYNHRAHPYTEALFSATPEFTPGKKPERRDLIEGDVLSPVDPPEGCRFASRCPRATELCRQKAPTWHEVGENHYAFCHLYDEEQ